MKTGNKILSIFALLLFGAFVNAALIDKPIMRQATPSFSWSNIYSGGTGFGGGYEQPHTPAYIPNINDPKFQPGGSNYLTEEDLQREYILIPVSGVG